MAIMAYWNGMTWGVSDKEIAFLESLTTSFGIDTSTNTDKEGKSPTESIAESLMEFSMSTTYRVETGTQNVVGKIVEWKSQIGKIGTLILGDTGIFGPENLQLQNIDLSDIQLSTNGIIRGVTMTFKFKEFSEEETSNVTASESDSTSSSVSSSSTSSSMSSGSTSTTRSFGSSSGTQKSYGTARNITASASCKALKKPVTIPNAYRV